MRERELRKEFIKSVLNNNKSYMSTSGQLKKGYTFLAQKFDTSENVIREIVNELRNSKQYKPVAAKADYKPAKPKPVNILTKSIKSIKPFLDGNPDNILVIGDTHEPFSKDGYLKFCRDTQEKFDAGTVVHIGDLTDNHAVS